LNAKQHEREADIVAQAGRKHTVTISTNMAGRGTDILLGGNAENLTKNEMGPLKADATPEEKAEYDAKFAETLKVWQARCQAEREEVKKLGGLFILGTERHESRRIDNQLRGRAGRQGDPGESRFYLSLDDDLMRIFGSVNIGRFMEEDLPIEHRWITKAIANAQKKVEGHNYDIRKHLLEYDDVMNQQRKVVYAWRKEVLSREDLRDMIISMVDELATATAEDFFPGGKLKKVNGNASLNMKELNDSLKGAFQTIRDIEEREINPFNGVGLRALINKVAGEAYAAKEKSLSDSVVRQLERMILLTTIDQLWKDHLLAMDHLREGIGLQGYGQKDPLIEYKKQGFRFFSMMMNQITGDVVRKLFAVQMAPNQSFDDQAMLEEEEEEIHPSGEIQYNIAADGSLIPASGAPAPAVIPPRQPQPSRPAEASPGPSSGSIDMERLGRQLFKQPKQMTLSRGPVAPGAGGSVSPVSAGDSGVDKVGRNDPCPCGSGKKYKKCHGQT
jgi:preprotein translocase subunit SecA